MSINNGSSSFSPMLIRSGSAVQLYEHILNVPILTITTEGGAPIVSKEDYVNATVELSNTTKPFTLTAEVRGRGNSTWAQPKKAYKIKFNSKTKPLGFSAKEKSWAILANYMEHSMLRNAIAFEIGRHTGLAWTPQYEYMEVILNGEQLGLYQMTDHIEIKSDRIDIDEMDDADITGLALTGGYSMEIDVRMEENDEPGFRTRLNVPVTLDEPDGSIAAQYDYIHGFIQEFEDVLFSDTFTDPVNGYAKYVDVNSFIDWYLVNEMLANNDSGFGASVKMYKKRDTATELGKLYLGPLWDFDLSIGVGAVYPVHSPTVWWTRNGATWIARMLEDPAFVVTMKSRWATLKASLVNDNYLYDFIDALAIKLEPQIVRDAKIWSVDRSGMGTVSYIKNWLQTRFAWIDSEFASPADTTPPTVPQNLQEVYSSAYQITLSWDASTDSGDELGTTGYRVWANGEIAAQTAIPYSTNLTSVTIGSLTADTEYTFTVQARDATGNWSGHSSPLVTSTETSAAGANGLSVFLDSAPSYETAPALYDDGFNITTGTAFYVAGQYSTGRHVVGARFWCPEDITLPAHVTLSLHTSYTINEEGYLVFDFSTPVATKTIETVAGPAWAEVQWGDSFALSPSTPVIVTARFVEAPNLYLYGTFPTQSLAPNIVSSPALYMAARSDELYNQGPRFTRAYFKYDGEAVNESNSGYFGTDILLDEPS